MPRLTVAGDDQVDEIYRESHALWGSGLEIEDYRALWRDLRRTPWGREHAAFYVWVDDDGGVLSSVKLYRPKLRWQDRTERITVVGAVFTPGSLRGCGHASRMLREVIRKTRLRGDRAVLLFTDIGTAYYEDLGFLPLSAQEDWGTLPRDSDETNDWSLGPLEPSDLDQVRRAHHAYCLTRPFAIIRDAGHWDFVQLRSTSFFARLGDPRLRLRQQVARKAGRFAGYLISIEGRGEWNVREVGAVGGDPRGLARVLRLGAVQARSAGLRGFYGWLPPEVRPLLPSWHIHTRERRRAIPMILPLVPGATLSGLTSPDATYLPFQDQF